jgi:hypothetical protein
MKRFFTGPAATPLPASRRTGRTRGVAIVIGLLASTGLVWQSSRAAFTATTDNPGNSWQAGAVTLDSNPATAMFTANPVEPDDPQSQCIDVTYLGNVATAGLQLYTAGKTESDGGSDGAVLDTQLMMQIRIGDANDTCATQGTATWTVLTTPVTGDSIEVLAGFTGWGDSLITGWSPAVSAESRAFLFTYELPTTIDLDKTQGDEVTLDFVWETRSA